MSKILRRPMFRGGGKVSSYGNGIATGLADGGRVNLGFGGALKGGLGTSNYSTATKGLSKSGFRFPRLSSSLRALGQVVPQALRGIGFNAATGAAALPAAGIYGLMKMNSADTDEGLKVMRNEPSGTFDETGAFEMEDYSERFNKANQQGNKISFMDNFLLDPETGTYPKFIGRSGDREKRQAIAAAAAEAEENIIVGEEKGDGKTDTERRLEMEKNALKELLDSFGSGSKKEDTEDEALAAIEKKQKLLEKVMGGGKSAKIQDLSSMALNYASGALKEGATVKSSFADFFEKESSRPSRSQKVKDAAANAAIQAYLTEKISEKDFSKQMALITGQAQIKQKFADAAKANLSIQDYVTGRGNNVSKSEAIENGARGIVQNNDEYKGFTEIDSEDNTPGLLVEDNLGEVFLDKKTKEVFAVILLEDGTIGKKVLYI